MFRFVSTQSLKLTRVEIVTAIIFLVSLSDYNSVLIEAKGGFVRGPMRHD